MATTDPNKLKVYEQESIPDIELPILPQWEGIINRPTSLADLDQDAQDSIDSNTATFLTLGDLAYLSSITTTEITDDAVTTPKIFAGAVTAAKMSVGQLSAITADMGSITAGTITGAIVQTATTGYRLKMSGADNAYQFLSGTTLLAELVADIIPDSGTAGAYLSHPTDNAYLGISGSAGSGWAGLGGSGGYLAVVSGISTSYIGTNLRLSADWVPETDSIYDIGSTTRRWDWGYFDDLDAGLGITLNGVRITAWTDISSGANTALSNLTTTSINQSLIPGDSIVDIGSTTNPWDWVYTDDLDIRGGNIYYNGAIAFDLATSTIWLGDAITSFRPGIGTDLGTSTEFFQTLYVNDIWMNNDIDMNNGQILDVNEILLHTGTANTASTEGAIAFYDSGTIQYRGQIISTEYSFDLTAA